MDPREVVGAYFAALDAGEDAALEALLAEDFVRHMPGVPPGRAVVRQHLDMFRLGFPDLSFTVEAILAEGDLVAARTTTTGTHAGFFMGHPPTGRRFTAGGIDLFRVGEGRLREQWSQFDTMSMLHQLGLYRPVPAGGAR